MNVSHFRINYGAFKNFFKNTSFNLLTISLVITLGQKSPFCTKKEIQMRLRHLNWNFIITL